MINLLRFSKSKEDKLLLLQTQNVTRRFGGEELFSGITFEIKNNARIGLVGRNGAGKSTLLKIIADIEAPDEGRVMRRKDLTIGFLDQHGGLESERSIWDEMLEVFRPILELEQKMRIIEEKMSTNQDKELNKLISSIEITIEHVNCQLKIFRILSEKYRSRIKTFYKRAILICYFYNYCL